MDHGAESHRVRSAVSVESKYRQWSRSHARAWDESFAIFRILKNCCAAARELESDIF